MKEVFRIRKGDLSLEDIVIPIDFGLVHEDDGIFYFELYIADSFNLLKFMKKNEDTYFRFNFNLKAKTDQNNELIATALMARNVRPHQSFMKMESYGYIKHIKLRNNKTVRKNEDRNIYFLEIEGLKMEHTDFTETFRARSGVEIDRFNKWKRDHTTAMLPYYFQEFPELNSSVPITFFPSEKENLVSVEFPNKNKTNLLSVGDFSSFKKDFVSFLSLLNGAEVAIRREFAGGFYIAGKVDSQTVITYSFKAIRNRRYNSYIPLNDTLYRGEHILGDSILKCFLKYVDENKILDLNSIIFYLNGAEQARSMEEKFFIQIIAFERLAQKYIDSRENEDAHYLEDEKYEPIKEEILLILNRHRKGKLKAPIDILKTKIGDLHKIKKTSTEYKFKKLIEYAQVSISSEIKVIIDEARHKSVHHGEIGDGEIRLINSFVLDELLRDIILNIIGYNKPRISKYRNS